jgi:drug/metabolite transporter (DMT)-like permease
MKPLAAPPLPGDSAGRPAFPPKAVLFVAVTALSFPAIFIRLAQADPLSIAFLRLAFAAAILLPIAGGRIKPALAALSPADRRRVAAAGIFLGIHLVLWITSVTKTTVASAAFLVITQPVMIAVLAHFFLRERMNRWVVWALLLTLAGSGLINFGDLSLQSQYLWGDFLALLSSLMAALYLLAGRSVRPQIRLLPYITIIYSVAALTVLPAVLLAGSPLVTLSGRAYFWIAMMTLVPTLIGHTLYNWALRYLRAFTVNSTIVVEPIVATILAWFLFREQPC